jgi:hypothetical protein
MRGLRPAAACLGLILVLAGRVEAENVDTTADIRCLAAFRQARVIVKDPAQLAAVAYATLYYVGCIDGREGIIDLPARVRDETAQMNQEAARLALLSCGKLMMEKGQILIQLGLQPQPKL